MYILNVLQNFDKKEFLIVFARYFMARKRLETSLYHRLRETFSILRFLDMSGSSCINYAGKPTANLPSSTIMARLIRNSKTCQMLRNVEK